MICVINAVYLGSNSNYSMINLEYMKKYGNINCAVFDDIENVVGYLEKNPDCIVFFEYPAEVCDIHAFSGILRNLGVGSALVAVTSEDDPDEISSMYRNGVSAVLIKPFDYELFSSVLNYFEEQKIPGSGREVSDHFWISLSRIFTRKGSSLSDDILNRLEDADYSAAKLSKKLKQPLFLVSQCLNELVYSGDVESYTNETSPGTVERIFRKKRQI